MLYLTVHVQNMNINVFISISTQGTVLKQKLAAINLHILYILYKLIITVDYCK